MDELIKRPFLHSQGVIMKGTSRDDLPESVYKASLGAANWSMIDPRAQFHSQM